MEEERRFIIDHSYLEANGRLRTYFHHGRPLRYRNGEIIQGSGDIPAGVYYIDRGLVKVYSISKRGEEYVHLVYKPGEVFPLIWALKNVLHDVFYESLTSSLLWQVPKDDFIKFIKKDPVAAYSLTGLLAEQFSVHVDRLDNLEYRHAQERVVYRLLTLTKRFGKYKDSRVVIEGPFTHQVIADSINLTRESVSREIERLEAKGLVRYSHRKIIITDINKLSRELD